MEGGLGLPTCPPTPRATALPLLQPLEGSWQLAHERLLSAERRLSKKSCLPSSTLASVRGLSPGMLTDGSPLGIFNSYGLLFCAVGPRADSERHSHTRLQANRVATTNNDA